MRNFKGGLHYEKIEDHKTRAVVGPMYEFLLDLSNALGNIQKGFQPDSSGDRLNQINLDDYLFKPGKFGGQTTFLDTRASGSGVFSSTKDATKGKIYFGSALTSVYDEANDRWGIGTAAPEVKLHVVGNPQPTVITASGDPSSVADVDAVQLFSVASVTLNGTNTITCADFAGIGSNPTAERWIVYGDDIPANTYVTAYTGTSITLSAAATGSGVVTLRFGALDRGWTRYPLAGGSLASTAWGTPGSSWEFISTNDSATSFIGRTGGGGGGARFYTLSASLGSGTSWTVTFWARIEGEPPSAGSLVKINLARADGNIYTGQLDATTLTTSWVEYTVTANSLTGSGVAERMSVQLTTGAAFTGYVEITYLTISSGSGGSSDAALTIFERTATSALPYSIWRDEGDVTVASITADGAGQFQNLILEDPGVGFGTITHKSPTSPTSHSLVWPTVPVDGGVLQVAYSGTTGTLSWPLPNTLATRIGHRWAANGPYIVDTNVDGAWVAPHAFTITKSILWRLTAGTGTTTVVLKQNGSTIDTRSVASTSPAVDTSGTLALSIASGDKLTIDCTVAETGARNSYAYEIEGY